MIGGDTFQGVAWTLDGRPNESAHAFNVTNVRLAVGLGGSMSGDEFAVDKANKL
jgi:hypothetical protein